MSDPLVARGEVGNPTMGWDEKEVSAVKRQGVLIERLVGGIRRRYRTYS
jgi:hypothetical protein